MSQIRERFSREVGPGGLEARGYVEGVDARDSDSSPMTISGIGSPYDQGTRIEGWFEEWDEVVAPGAWRTTINRANADIISTFNHDVNHLLARTSNGTLELTETREGLVYRSVINPDDPNAVGVHARVARGDVSGSSVWFRVTKDQWEDVSDDNDLEVPKRTILEAELFEVGPVVFPAFPQTTSEASRAAGFSDLGVSRASLKVLDGALTAAGVTRSGAAYASKFLADPSRAEEDIRALFARTPDLRAKVCDTKQDCSCSGRATDAASPQSQADRRRALADRELFWRTTTR